MADPTVQTDPVQSARPVAEIRSSSVVSEPSRPARHASNSSFNSPDRHHNRQRTAPRRVKETLDAHSEYTTSQDDGSAQHRINQYIIKQEIGRGSFGAVHLAVDQYGDEYAVKEFSKARLRKRQKSHMIRRIRGPQRPGTGFNSPLHRHPTSSDDLQNGHPLELIREEIAVMKKLNHSNLVSLIEVLDDPSEDSLYMVMEMCQKGVIMKVGLEEKADPYDDERCRLWFRDLILGIEYLHAQGIVHRDIKPDNCLLTSDDVLKVVDFGVSEMFAKDSDMYTAKSAGSPAFLPPELCVVKHGDVSGKAADIWSMGVTLYCLRYGHIPFEKQSIFELYESIRQDDFILEGETDDDFIDLMHKILEKDPSKRITMKELRDHSWVTKTGTDPLLPEEENTAQTIEPPTEEEMNSAITKTMGSLIVLMKAVQRFKKLVDPAKAPGTMHSILGQEYDSHFVQPPMEMDPDEGLEEFNPYKRVIKESDLRYRRFRPQTVSQERGRSPKRAGSGLSSKQDSDGAAATPTLLLSSRDGTPSTKRSTSEGTRGHASNPLEEESAYLFIGPSTYDGRRLEENPMATSPAVLQHLSEPDSSFEGETELPFDRDAIPVVSESPGACDIDIYETAYREEIERIQLRTVARRDTMTKVYLTRRVEEKKHHLSEVMKLILRGHSESASNGGSQPTLQIGDKISGAFASAGAAVSALTSQLEERRLKAFPPPLPATPDPASSNDDHSRSSSQPRTIASLSDIVEAASATAERSKSGLKSLIDETTPEESKTDRTDE